MSIEKNKKRILFTSIGGRKTSYNPTKYKIKKENGEEIIQETSYMPLILENTFNVDKTIILGTATSMWDNIYEKYMEKENRLSELDEEFKSKLSGVRKDIPINKIYIEKINEIKKLNEIFKGKVRGIITKYGVNEKEINENFDVIIKVQEEFNDEDEYEVILDITHSFRSNAFWMFLIINYLIDVSNKKVSILYITYGMYELEDNKTTPIVVLTPFIEILNWIKGASELKKYGNSYSVLENLKDKILKDELERFSDAMNMNYIGSILESLDKLAELKKNNALELSGPAKHIVPDVINNFIDNFDIDEDDEIKKKYTLQAILAKWHFSQKRYAMTAININEALEYFVLLTLNIKSKRLRGKSDPGNQACIWLEKIYKTYKNIERTELEEKIYKYGETYNETKRIRNEIAHSLGKEMNMKEDIKRLEVYSENIVEMLKNEDFIREFEKEYMPIEDKHKNTDEEENEEKNECVKIQDNLIDKSILVITSRGLSKAEMKELKGKWNFKNIITLNDSEIEKWRGKEQSYFKKLIEKKLNDGDYVLIGGDFVKSRIMMDFSKSKNKKILYFLDRDSSKDMYFAEY